MQVWMLWHGGAGSSVPEIPRDLEQFDTVRDAKHAFWRRGDFHPYYPCVNETPVDEGGAQAWIYFYDPTDVADPYPDRILSYGPRGGIRLEYA